MLTVAGLLLCLVGSPATNAAGKLTVLLLMLALCCSHRALAVPDYWRDEYEAALSPGEPGVPPLQIKLLAPCHSPCMLVGLSPCKPALISTDTFAPACLTVYGSVQGPRVMCLWTTRAAPSKSRGVTWPAWPPCNG
jgi:hypothetical protein